MKAPLPALRVRIYIGEHLQHEGRPAYEVLVNEARKHGIAGATVLKGMMGYGSHGEVHTGKILRLAEHLPLCVEFVDLPEKVRPFIEWMQGILKFGHATIENVELIHFGEQL
ncbi:DUF190 domain-containing protein [bacterium]|nr:DUF190 domain-containing protein [bacterium]